MHSHRYPALTAALLLATTALQAAATTTHLESPQEEGSYSGTLQAAATTAHLESPQEERSYSGVLQAAATTAHLESPQEGGTYSGIANLRGWALSESGIDRIELYINGEYHAVIPMGGERGDVAQRYPDSPGAERAGFSMAYNYGNLAPGTHHFAVRIYHRDGHEVQITRSLEVLRFGERRYLDPTTKIDFSEASFSGSGQHLQITNMQIDGQAYNATLSWSSESQQFQYSR